jgi:3-isopropylmalate/(R)-2-methylmalate dehydratase small subunit
MMAERIIRGKVVKLGDFVNTDVISPSRWMREGLDVLRLHTMEAIRPDFYKDVQPGDILVGGRNFGCGSHREPATEIMKVLNFSAIVADSVARLYYRNCIAFGIPVFGVDGISRIIEEGEEMEIIMGEDRVTFTNTTSGGSLSATPIPETMAKVLEAGGVYKLLKRVLQKNLNESGGEVGL